MSGNGSKKKQAFLCCSACDNGSYVFTASIMDGTKKQCKYCHEDWAPQLRVATWLHGKAGYKLTKQPGTPPWRSNKQPEPEAGESRGNRELPDQLQNYHNFWWMADVAKESHPNLWEACTATKQSYDSIIYMAISKGIGGQDSISLQKALDSTEKAIITKKGAREVDLQKDKRITHSYDQLMDKMNQAQDQEGEGQEEL